MSSTETVLLGKICGEVWDSFGVGWCHPGTAIDVVCVAHASDHSQACCFARHVCSAIRWAGSDNTAQDCRGKRLAMDFCGQSGILREELKRFVLARLDLVRRVGISLSVWAQLDNRLLAQLAYARREKQKRTAQELSGCPSVAMAALFHRLFLCYRALAAAMLTWD
eukprot:3858319-Amphidinium_carterae.1